MRVAAIYDIHGNLPALEAVLRDIGKAEVDLVVVGGDVVPGPMPRETLMRVLDLDIPVRFIRGNGDRVVASQMEGIEPAEVPEQFRDVIRYSAQELSSEHGNILASWPETVRVQVSGVGEVLFCHATPRSDTEVFTRLTPEHSALPAFEGVSTPMAVCGHTHMQFDRMIGDVRVVNAGSVGMPFGIPGAYWLLLDHGVELQQTTYDFANAAERIRQTNYPRAHEFAERNILQPPSEKQMLEVFTKVELK
ncbi:MAG: phosphoesterase [Chthoniobacterales bacterium]|nr:MAG: phosphoesterase [Chthoniobacterales bacterium]